MHISLLVGQCNSEKVKQKSTEKRHVISILTEAFDFALDDPLALSLNATLTVSLDATLALFLIDAPDFSFDVPVLCLSRALGWQ